MPAFKLLPACKDYIWGGQRLKTDFGVHSELDPLAEAWVLSCHPRSEERRRERVLRLV